MVTYNNDIGAVMMVYTGESPEQIIKSGVVTTPLPFNLDRAEACKYVVCCQNGMIDGATEPHNAAFLIGIVTGSNEAQRNGKLMGVSLNISHYVLITKRDAWYAKRNVSHFFFDSLKDAKIRLGRYDFTMIGSKPVVAKSKQPAMASRVTTGKGLRKVARPEPIEAEIESIETINERSFREYIASRLGIPASKVNVTVTISI